MLITGGADFVTSTTAQPEPHTSQIGQDGLGKGLAFIKRKTHKLLAAIYSDHVTF